MQKLVVALALLCTIGAGWFFVVASNCTSEGCIALLFIVVPLGVVILASFAFGMGVWRSDRDLGLEPWFIPALRLLGVLAFLAGCYLLFLIDAFIF